MNKVGTATRKPAARRKESAPKPAAEKAVSRSSGGWAPGPAKTRARPTAAPHPVLARADQLFTSVGVEAGRRATPRDVQAAKAAFDPSKRSATQRKWAALIDEAMKELGGGRVFVNRPADNALKLLTEGGRFSAAFDRAGTSEEVDGYLQTRRRHEERLGTHGVGAQAGKTVYGSVEFSGARSAEPDEDGLLKAVKQGRPLKRDSLNDGISLTEGAVTFVMKNDVLDQSTFLPGDTYITWQTPPVAREHLAYAVLENIMTQGDVYFSSAKGSDELFKLPKRQAVDAIKHYLTSSALNRSYLEAQVRAPTLDDVAYVVIRDGDDARRSPGATRPLDDVLADVRRAAKARGLEVIDEHDLARR